MYADAVIPPTDKVCLWLGANVMLEYTLDGEFSPPSSPHSAPSHPIIFPDAEELLTKNCESAEKSLKQIAFDLDYLRDQMTITEVTMARLYNWDVKRRKEKKASA